MPIDSDRALVGQGIDAGYGSRHVLHGVDIEVPRGAAVAVVGPNGAGKSTLLKTLCGGLRPMVGSIRLDGVDIRTLGPRELARRIAVVPQALHVGFGMTGRDVVMLGRTPYLGFLGSSGTRDLAAVSEAIEDTDIADFVDRPFSTLSGGEAQRVVLAMALAQETSYLLLDEPTVHLDLGQQWRLMERLMELRRRRGVGILAILHDLSLAGLNFDRVVLLGGGRVVASGSPHEVLTESNVGQAFGAPVRVLEDADGVRVVLQGLPTPPALQTGL